MNGNTELLNYVYQNSEMGVNTIKQLLDITTDEEFKENLNFQLSEYRDINLEAKKLLNEHGYDEKGINALTKIRTYLAISLQTMTDKSTSHIAEMLIVGSNMGIVNAIKNLKKYKDAEEAIKNLMERLLRFEENNVQQLKKFL